MTASATARSLRVAAIVAVLLILASGPGCSLRARIRESERQTALANARTWHEHRKWDKCVASAERAQATLDLEPQVAVETTELKAECLRGMGRRTEALAHYRLLRDFIIEPGRDAALPRSVAKRLAAEPSLETARSALHNQANIRVVLPGARLPKAAKWSGIAGQVLIQFEINKLGAPAGIRVLNAVHPLLGGLAIEAAASAVIDAEEIRPDLLPTIRRVRLTFGDP